jgi:hypothetical protein
VPGRVGGVGLAALAGGAEHLSDKLGRYSLRARCHNRTEFTKDIFRLL